MVSSEVVTKDGKPTPPPKFKNSTTNSTGTEVTLSGRYDDVFYIPALTKMESFIPDIDYDSALNILKDLKDEIEQDLPELRYSSIKDGSLSGKAIKLLLGSAVDRATEFQGNFLANINHLNRINPKV